MKILPVNNTSFGKLIIKSNDSGLTKDAVRDLLHVDRHEIMPVMDDTFEKLDKKLNGRDVVLAGMSQHNVVNLCLYDAKTKEPITWFSAFTHDDEDNIQKIKKAIMGLYTGSSPLESADDFMAKYKSREYETSDFDAFIYNNSKGRRR